MFPALLRVAVGHATGGLDRSFLLAAVGERKDGAIVLSRNGTSTKPEPTCHAEFRCTRKLDRGATIYVARVSRQTGKPTMAKPCKGCENRMRAMGVRRAIYTIDENEYGVLDLQ